VIPNFIPLEKYTFRHRETAQPHLLFLRTFHPLYNPILALKVYRLVKERLPHASLTMGGMDRNHESQVRETAGQMGLEDVRFLGPVSKSDIPALMDSHDIYLNTPHIDNTPVTVLEALASGMIVISTNVGGIPYLLQDGETGLLVPDDDAEGMAGAVFRILESPDLVGQMSRQGRKRVEDFTWDTIRPMWAMALTGTNRTGTPAQEDANGE
jgi:glycosyltransferase involved in cell wall biosynthesis